MEEKPGEVAGEGLPEKEPETIGEALKKYYEEQLNHAENANVKVLTQRQAELEKIIANHIMALN